MRLISDWREGKAERELRMDRMKRLLTPKNDRGIIIVIIIVAIIWVIIV